MINPQWLELPMSRTNFHGPKDVRAIEVRLYFGWLHFNMKEENHLIYKLHKHLRICVIVSEEAEGQKLITGQITDHSVSSLRKHAYSNIQKILPPKNENFQIKKI